MWMKAKLICFHCVHWRTVVLLFRAKKCYLCIVKPDKIYITKYESNIGADVILQSAISVEPSNWLERFWKFTKVIATHANAKINKCDAFGGLFYTQNIVKWFYRHFSRKFIWRKCMNRWITKFQSENWSNICNKVLMLHHNIIFVCIDCKH